MKIRNAFKATFLLLALSGIITGCAAPGGQVCLYPPVVSEELQPDKSVNKSLIDDHVYFSKEASSGGRTFGAGGCGCN